VGDCTGARQVSLKKKRSWYVYTAVTSDADWAEILELLKLAYMNASPCPHLHNYNRSILIVRP